MKRAPTKRQGLSLGGLAFGILAVFSIVSIALRLSPGWGLLVLAGGMALLGAAAWVWGVDSRDGKNWK